jgi:DNA-binding SARP family transcriptional activator
VESSAPAAAGRQPRVELRLAGAFTVIRDGAELTAGQIGSRKSRTLLKLLAVSRPGLVPADQIADVLWDRHPPPGAGRNIAALVSRLRAVLGPDVIRGGPAGYRLGEVSVDLDAAARLCDRADRKLMPAPAVALAAADRAGDLLSTGVALAEEPYASWAEPARAEMRALQRRARLTAARAALRTSEPGLAGAVAAAAVAADPFDEEAHRLYMSAAAAAGDQPGALRAYAALAERLSAELGTDPAPPTRKLHQAILREQDLEALGRPGEARSAWRRAGELAVWHGIPRVREQAVAAISR